MLKNKRILAVLFAVIMLIQTLPLSGFAAETDDFTDFPKNSWSTEAMTAAVENGLLVGTSETTIEPHKNLTRAEFAAIITRAFGATEKADISNFEDVDADKWYAEPIAKVVQMGVMNGTGDTTFAPDAYMKREDVILALARVLFVDGDDTSVLNQFSDKNDIDSWAVKAIAGMVSEDYVHGYEDGTIRPQNLITREELAQLFHNIFKTYISEDGEYSTVATNGSVIVRSKYVTLKDVTINGDLIMADGIGDGDFRISNVHVTGKIIARGGEGMNYFVDVTSEGKVIVNDPNGTVNFYNYRDEDTPFKNDNVIENTPATFLERVKEDDKPSSGPSVGSSYKLIFKNENGTNVKSISKSNKNYVILDSDVPTNEEMAKDGFEFQGWSKKGSVEVLTRDKFIGKAINDVKGTYYPVYVEIDTPDEYTITFVTPGGEVPVTKTEGETIASDEIPEITVDESQEFKGWTKTEGSTNVDFTNDQLTADVVENVFDSTDVKLYPVIVDKDATTVVFKHTDGDVTITKYNNPDYVLTDADVPADPEKADNTFKGWAKDPAATEGEDRDYFIGKKISEVEGTWYPVFEENEKPVRYTVEFKYTDGSEALPTVTKELLSADDYVLTTTDVKDVEHNVAPDDYEFLGWTTTVDGTDYIASADIAGKSIKDVDGTTYYAQFKKVTDNYTVVFKYTDGTEINKVEKTLSASEDYVLTSTDVDDVDYHTNPADFTFLGWTETVSGTDYKTSAELQVSIKDLDGKTFYAQYERAETTYSVSFKYEDGTDALPAVEKNLVASEDYVLTNVDVKDVAHPTSPADYKFLGWSEAGSTVVVSSAELQASIKTLDGKTFYAQYERAETTYSVSFKYEDGTDALPAVEKNLVASEDYVLTNADVKDVAHPTAPADYKFLGWSEAGSTVVVPSADLEKSIKDLDGKTYYAQFEKVTDNYTVVFKYTDGTEINKVEKTLSASEDYVLTSTDVDDVDYHTNPADFTFLGWTETVSGTDYKTSAELQVSIKDLDGKTFYAQYERAETTYSVSFKYEDGTDALPAVEKNLVASEDYVLTNADVKDVAHPTAPADYKFLGWSEAGSTVVVPSADLEKSIKDLDGKTYYAQFEEIEKSVTYKVEFKYTNDTVINTVEKSLLSSEDYVLTVSDVYDVENYVDPSMYEFLGWTEAVDGTDYKTSAELQVSIKTLGSVYYAQFKHIDEALYKVEHYFEQLDGTYVLDTTKELYEYPGIDVTATALTTLPDGYEGENVDHADRVAEGTVIAEGEADYPLTLKLYYDLKVLTVEYYDLAYDTAPVLTYEVKYGGTIENFYDPADETRTNDEIQTEIEEYVEYAKLAGYGKDYDDEYLYSEFDDKLDGYYYYPFGAYDHEHEINLKWYVEDDVEEFVVFDKEHVFTEDLDLYSKVKKLNVVIGFPENLTDEVLTINVPYEESTRFLDSVRDALFINDNIATFPEMTGVEDKFYDKLTEIGGRFFEGNGVLNDEYEINNTDVMIYFYQMMGGKDAYRDWLWNEVEDNLLLDLSGQWERDYNSLRNIEGLNQQQALKKFYEDKCFGEPPEYSTKKYYDSKMFIEMSTEEDRFIVTVNNEFIMEKVEEKISSLASIDAVIDEYAGGRIPEGLLNRLPMDIVEDIYEPRVQRFLDQLDAARTAAANGEPEENCMVDSGIIFDINLVEEFMIPLMEYAEDSHTKAVNKAVSSDNKAAELIEKYYVDNPYVTGKAGNYGVVNYAFNPDFYVEDADGDGLYSIKSFYDIYTTVVMPEAVETIDALLWYMDEEGGAVDFARIRNIAEENEDLILALHNHPNMLMKEYAENGLPEDMITYYEDLLSDPEIKAAVEKLDNKVSFDMMYFVESKIQNATLEMYYLKALDRVGVPVENILSKYTGSKAYKELTHEDFTKLLDQLEECWATETVEVDGVEMEVENANGTTDYVFDNVLEKVGNSGNKATASIKGFEMTITRFFADDYFQKAP